MTLSKKATETRLWEHLKNSHDMPLQHPIPTMVSILAIFDIHHALHDLERDHPDGWDD